MLSFVRILTVGNYLSSRQAHRRSISWSGDLVHMGTSDPVFLSKSKIIFASFNFFWKKYLNVANYLSYKLAKIHIQIPFILSYTKITNV
jgi:hypothetical protein